MSATTDRRRDLAYEKNDHGRYEVFDDSEIARWVRDQERAQSDDSFPDNKTASQTHESRSVHSGPVAEVETAAGQSLEKGTQRSAQMAGDRSLSSQHDRQRIRDRRLVSGRDPVHQRWLRLAIICFVVMMLVVGVALAWRGSSTISIWAKSAVSLLRPKATKPQPTTADLGQRIDALTSQIEALKQQINQLNAAQAQLNSAQAQSARSAAEQQLKIAALQQLLEQKTEALTPKPPHPDVATKKKPPAAVPQPHPRLKPKSQAAMPLTIIPPPAAQH
jgi:hypothetical protein